MARKINRETMDAYNSIHYDGLTYDKFALICKYAHTSPMNAADFINGGDEGWSDSTPEEMAKFLKTEHYENIADWINHGI